MIDRLRNTYSKFFSLSYEKQVVILNAAINEFVRGGFDKASVNTIVENANISKGSLFFYFESKKNLYLFLFEYCEFLIIENARKSMHFVEGDFIARMQLTMHQNLTLLETHPSIFAFVKSCKGETDATIKPYVSEIVKASDEKILSHVYHNIDRSLFRDKAEIELAITTIKATLFHVTHTCLADQTMTLKDAKSEIDRFIVFFRTHFYKVE